MIFKSKLSIIFYIIAVLCMFLGRFGRYMSCSENNRKENLQTEEVNSQDLKIPTDPFLEKAIEIASSLDTNHLVAQLLITGIDGRGELPSHIVTLLEEIPAGGVMLFRFNLDTNNNSIRSLITQTKNLITEKTSVSPFIAVDFEGGTVNRFRGNVELPAAGSLPAAASYRELLVQGKEEITIYNQIESDAFVAGFEISNLGINMNFAPVAEHLNEYNRVFLYSRSYSSDYVFTAKAAAAFIRGMENNGILCVVKHFPGSAGRDPHYAESVINIDRNGFNNLVYPFKEIIYQGHSAIMIAHTKVPSIDNEIASLSSVFINDILREDWGFNGIIIADDFIMASALASGLIPEQAAVKSIANGTDMILVWPENLRKTYAEFIKALDDGRLTRERLEEAAARIIYEKLKMGLITVPIFFQNAKTLK